MRKVLLSLLVAFSIVFAAAPHAQTTYPTPVSYEAVTLDATAGGVGLSAATLTVSGSQVKACSGTLEAGAIRYRYDGLGAVTTSEGNPLAVGQFIKIEGFTDLSRFRGIRTTGTSGVIRFTCSR